MLAIYQRDLLIVVNPFWLSPREQMYNCQKWLANSLKAGSAAPVGRYKVAPTGAIFAQKCGRWHFENAVGRENPANVTGNQEYIKIGNEATSKIATIVHQKR